MSSVVPALDATRGVASTSGTAAWKIPRNNSHLIEGITTLTGGFFLPITWRAAIVNWCRCADDQNCAAADLAVIAPDIRRYETFMHNVLFKLPEVDHVRSSIMLRELKYEPRMPLA